MSSPPGRILKVLLEEVLSSKSDIVFVQDTTPIILEPLRKQIGEDQWKLYNLSMAQTKEDMRTDRPKDDDSRIPMEIWDRMDCTY